ncbi:hypothetical protein V6Z11_D05G320300 [Gossypium hirsutum]
MFLNINSIILKYTTSRMILRLEENEELYPIGHFSFKRLHISVYLENAWWIIFSYSYPDIHQMSDTDNKKSEELK